jgi:hypothetical protein
VEFGSLIAVGNSFFKNGYMRTEWQEAGYRRRDPGYRRGERWRGATNLVSTRRWRFLPLIFLPPSKPS